MTDELTETFGRLPTPEELAADPRLDPNLPILDDAGMSEDDAVALGLVKTLEEAQTEADAVNATNAEIQARAEAQFKEALHKAWDAVEVSPPYVATYHVETLIEALDARMKHMQDLIAACNYLQVTEALDTFHAQRIYAALNLAQEAVLQARNHLYGVTEITSNFYYKAKQAVLKQYPEGRPPQQPPTGNPPAAPAAPEDL